MSVELREDDSLRELQVEWILLDPSRFLQIFINLMTNAIKFTRTEMCRHITIVLGASLSRPSELGDVIDYIPKSPTHHDHTLDEGWSAGEIIYLSISVTDTGRGLSEEEKDVLFQVFQQASPKTHIRYGRFGFRTLHHTPACRDAGWANWTKLTTRNWFDVQVLHKEQTGRPVAKANTTSRSVIVHVGGFNEHTLCRGKSSS
jgi:hypothetical protein